MLFGLRKRLLAVRTFLRNRTAGCSANLPATPSGDNRLRLRELPGSIEYFIARMIQPHCVVPASHDGKVVGGVLIPAEMDRHRAVSIWFGCDAVERVCVFRIPLEVAFLVVDAHRPKSVDRDILDGESVSRLAIIILRYNPRVERSAARVPAPAHRGPKQVLNRIDF